MHLHRVFDARVARRNGMYHALVTEEGGEEGGTVLARRRQDVKVGVHAA